jgi:hypothetical protein
MVMPPERVSVSESSEEVTCEVPAEPEVATSWACAWALWLPIGAEPGIEPPEAANDASEFGAKPTVVFWPSELTEKSAVTWD